MNDALIRSFNLVLLIALGYVLKRVGVFKQEDSKLLAKIMLNITLPAVLINAFRDFTLDPQLVSFLLVALLMGMFMVLVGWLAGRREAPLGRATYMVCMAGFNIGSFAIPFVQSLFPDHLMAVVMFDVGNTVVNCGMAYSFAATQLDRSQKFSFRALGKTLLSTLPFDLYIGLFLMSLFHIRFPAPVYQLADTVAGANALVVMLMLGILFEPRLKPDARRQVLGIVRTRVLVEAAVAVALVVLLPFPMEQRLVAAMLVCAPVGSMATVFCEKLGADPNVYGTATSLTIPISVAVMLAVALVQSL